MKYQNKRGGRILLTDVKAPPKSEWGTAVDAFSVALQLEKDVNQVTNIVLLLSTFNAKPSKLLLTKTTADWLWMYPYEFVNFSSLEYR